MIDRAKRRYYENEEKKLTTLGADRLAFKALRNLKSAEREEEWTADDLRPGMDRGQLVEELADYFSSITQKLPPLGSVPSTYDRVTKLSLIHI